MLLQNFMWTHFRGFLLIYHLSSITISLYLIFLL
jgi:hypothetical protein